MTNSRLTDPEVLEWRYPVRVDAFAVRDGSGGRGRWTGGNGVVRRIRFLEPMTVTLLTGHRTVPPYGMAGGEPGEVGGNEVERADGTRMPLRGSTRWPWPWTTYWCCAPRAAGIRHAGVNSRDTAGRWPVARTAGRPRESLGLLRRFDRCQSEDLICAT